jgi:acyl-CoA thioester hydrolase
MNDKPLPGRRADYVAFQRHTTRWWDNDAYRHINNAIYYSFFDTAVNQVLIEAGVLDIKTSPTIGLVVETGCRFYAPIAFPDMVHSGLRITKLGASSVRYEIGLFRNDETQASAEGWFVHVYVDSDNRRPCPIPEAARALLETLKPPTP